MINTELFNHCSVLIVDDQSTSRGILSQMIRGVNSKIQVTEKESSVESIKWASEHTADLVFVDYEMPEMNGIEFVRLLRTLTNYASVPVVMITIKNDAKTRYEALNSGMTDFLSKPLDTHECTARTKNLLTMRCQHTELEHKSWTLEQSVKRATEKIKLREKETLIRLARAGEYKDFDTAMHLRRISLYSRLLAEAIGFDETEAELIELASPLHDIGKIGIPDSILLKKGALDPGELKIMRDHTRIGRGHRDLAARWHRHRGRGEHDARRCHQHGGDAYTQGGLLLRIEQQLGGHSLRPSHGRRTEGGEDESVEQSGHGRLS